MKDQTVDFKKLLREWIEGHTSRPISGGLQDDTPILEQRVISSLQVMELILFIERTAGRPVTPQQLKPGAFRTLDTIHDTFFAEAIHE